MDFNFVIDRCLRPVFVFAVLNYKEMRLDFYDFEFDKNTHNLIKQSTKTRTLTINAIDDFLKFHKHTKKSEFEKFINIHIKAIDSNKGVLQRLKIKKPSK